jgi:hypothetical protein
VSGSGQCTVDPDQAVLLVHFVGDVPRPVLVQAGHFGDAGDGVDVVDIVGWGRPTTAAAMADALGVQFHGSSSSS